MHIKIGYPALSAGAMSGEGAITLLKKHSFHEIILVVVVLSMAQQVYLLNHTMVLSTCIQLTNTLSF